MQIFMSWVFMFFSTIIIIPYLTLFERKILSYMQKRKGPNKVSFLGLLQPVFDGVKLMIKEPPFVLNSNFFIFILSPFFSFMIMIFSWGVLPNKFSFYMMKYSLIWIIILSSFNIYSLLGSGWGSNKKYSLLGAIRGSCQVVSYEVNLIFMIIFPSFFLYGFKLWDFYSKGVSFSLFSFFIFLIWILMILLETKRSPFDFAEGESELVSGFKTEYSSLMFAFLFLGEYGNMALLSVLSVFLFFWCGYYLYFLFFLAFCFWFIWVRATFPRFRYDLLMSFCWKFILPVVMGFLFTFLLFI